MLFLISISPLFMVESFLRSKLPERREWNQENAVEEAEMIKKLIRVFYIATVLSALITIVCFGSEDVSLHKGRSFSMGDIHYVISGDGSGMIVMKPDERRPDEVKIGDSSILNNRGDFLSYGGKLYFTEGNYAGIACYDPVTDEAEKVIAALSGNTTFIGALDNKILLLSKGDNKVAGSLVLYDVETGQYNTWYDHGIVQAGIVDDKVFIELLLRDSENEEDQFRTLVYCYIGADSFGPLNPGNLRGSFISDKSDLYFITDGEESSERIIKHFFFGDDGTLKGQNLEHIYDPEVEVELIGMAGGIPYFTCNGILGHIVFEDGIPRFISHGDTDGKEFQVFFAEEDVYYYLEEERTLYKAGNEKDEIIMKLPEGAQIADVEQGRVYYDLDEKTYMALFNDIIPAEEPSEKKDAKIEDALRALLPYLEESFVGSLLETEAFSDFARLSSDDFHIRVDLNYEKEDVPVNLDMDYSRDSIKLVFSTTSDGKSEEAYMIADGSNLRIKLPIDKNEMIIPYSSQGILDKELLNAAETTVERAELTIPDMEKPADTVYHIRFPWEQVEKVAETVLDSMKQMAVSFIGSYDGRRMSDTDRSFTEIFPELAALEGEDLMIDIWLSEGKPVCVTAGIWRDIASICPENSNGELLNATEIDSYTYRIVEDSVDNISAKLYIYDEPAFATAEEREETLPEYQGYLYLWLRTQKHIRGDCDLEYYSLETDKRRKGEILTSTLQYGLFAGIDPYTIKRTLDKGKYQADIYRGESCLYSLEMSEREDLDYDTIIRLAPGPYELKLEGTMSVTDAEPLPEGWKEAESLVITDEARAAFDKAMNGLDGPSYEPLDLLGTQTADGMNYCFLCRGEAQEYSIIYVHEDLQGNAKVLDIQTFEMGVDPEEGNVDIDYSEKIEEAIDLIRDAWQEEANRLPYMRKPSVDVKNTRIIKIAEEPQADNKVVEELKDIDCFIEFILLTNYFGDSYPVNAGILDSVVVYRDGSMEMHSANLRQILMRKNLLIDCDGIIDEIIDLGDAYNGQLF